MATNFESRDLGWNGIERRQQQRRQMADRRQTIRFEPEKHDRRRTHGRRKGERGGWSDVQA